MPFEMYLSGVSFFVLADHFVIHQSHTYEEQARREEVRSLLTSPEAFDTLPKGFISAHFKCLVPCHWILDALT